MALRNTLRRLNGLWHLLLIVFLSGSSACNSSIDGADAGGLEDHMKEADPTGTGTGAVECEEVATLTFVQRHSHPDVILVLDRSGSMRLLLGAPESRWATLTKAVVDVVLNNRQLQFGLLQFPDEREGCNVGPINVEPTPSSSTPVLEKMNESKSPIVDGDTPTALAIANVHSYYLNRPEELKNPDGEFVILMTDGASRCNWSPVGEVEKLLSIGIKTYVIGYHSEVEELTAMALAGGTNRPYSANNLSDLTTELREIVKHGVEAKCTFDLSRPPVDPSRLTMAMTEKSIDQSADNGWTYAPSTSSVTLHGQACLDLKESGISKLEVGLGCVPVIVE